eukprot:1027610-Pleurochrysis_carterae.AAC.1
MVATQAKELILSIVGDSSDLVVGTSPARVFGKIGRGSATIQSQVVCRAANDPKILSFAIGDSLGPS